LHQNATVLAVCRHRKTE